jgi:hypothetical protein
VSLRRRRRQIEVLAQVSGSTAIAGGVLGFVREVTANELSALGQWVPVIVMVAGLLIYVGLWALRHWSPLGADDEGAGQVALPLPHVDELVGRDGDVDNTVAKAQAHGVVLVHGPDGIGAGSVAIKAARELVPDEERHRYVDLQGLAPDDRRRARIQVLRTLGVAPRLFESRSDRAAELAERALVGTVLVLDNVTGAPQVRWISHRVRDAYVIIAGDLSVEDLPPEIARVAPAGLKEGDALDLLSAQDAAWPPGAERLRWWRRRRAAPANSIARRIDADRKNAERLAKDYLQLPRVAIELGRWLARNRHVSFEALLADLRQHEENFELNVILRRQLDGASAGALRLLALLAQAPQTAYSDEALGELARLPRHRVSTLLAELAARFMVERTSSRYRLTAQAASLADPVRPRARARALARLIAHYAELVTAHADALDPGGPEDERREAEEWLKTADVTLLRLLSMPAPPRAAAEQLWRIADALDLWFTREQRPSDRKAVAEVMAERAKQLGDQVAGAIADLRLAAMARARGGPKDREEARRLLDGVTAALPEKTPCRPQLHTGWALLHLEEGDYDAAREHVRLCRAARPLRDSRGKLIDLINLAAIDIQDAKHDPDHDRRSRALDSAHDQLSHALDLAETLHDAGGEAHALELRGIAYWYQGHPGRAPADWRAALALYTEAWDLTGLARCERHCRQAGSS